MDDSRAFVERGRCCFELHVRGFNHGAAGLLEFTLVDTVLSNLFYKGMNRCGRRDGDLLGRTQCSGYAVIEQYDVRECTRAVCRVQQRLSYLSVKSGHSRNDSLDHWLRPGPAKTDHFFAALTQSLLVMGF
jgi:hypothetical protein